MPLVEFSHVEPFLHQSFRTVLSKEADFTPLQDEAARFICDRLGIDEPVDVAGAPSYLRYPAAIVITKLALGRIGTASKELIELIERDFDRVCKYLDEKKAGGISTALDYAKSAKHESEGLQW